MSFLRTLFGLSRRSKRLVVVLSDAACVALAYHLAFGLRLGRVCGYWSGTASGLALLAGLSAATLLAGRRLGLYRCVVHAMSPDAGRVLGQTAALSAAALYGGSLLLSMGIPRSVPLLYGAVLFILVGGSRMLAFAAYHAVPAPGAPRVVVFGAGDSGVQLVANLQMTRRFEPVAFVDDDPAVQGTQIRGLPVRSPDALPAVIREERVAKILVAVPSASPERRRSVLQRLRVHGLPIMVQPSLGDVVAGTFDPSTLHQVDVTDLLGREPVAPVGELLYRNTRGGSVMVTGAGGSIGSELCRQIAAHGPARLVLMEISEPALYAIHQELSCAHPDLEVVPLLSDLRDRSRIAEVMRAYGTTAVYHAAAYKHVPMVERNVAAGVRNNVLGTWNAAQAAVEAGVGSFTLISTDKAVRPTNVMGCTKRCCELELQCLAAEQSVTRFSMVRFGNVLGSSGSVIPLFRRQIESGGPVTVTHEDITRYFMTIPEAVSLVLQASGMAEGGDVFVLDMGKPVRIYDMAREMIALSGRTVRDAAHPDGEIEIRVTGLRPGEKLYEELLVSGGAEPTAHPRILRQRETALPGAELRALVAALDAAALAGDVPAIVRALSIPAIAYAPEPAIHDEVWKMAHGGKAS